MDQINKNSNDESFEFLEGLKDQSSFKVPANYFAEMQASVLDQVIGDESALPQAQSWSIWDSIKSILKPSYALATVTAVAIFGLLLFPTSDPTTSVDAFAELSDTDLEYFLSNEIDDSEGIELMAILSEDDIDLTAIPIQEEATPFPETMTDDYINEIDESILIEFSEE